MAELRNDEWDLPELIEHLSADLDEVADTLALRSQRRDSVYSPANISIELYITSRYDAGSGRVLFRNGQPGDQGLSKLKLELAPVMREQLQMQAHDLVRPRDPRLIDEAFLDGLGIMGAAAAVKAFLRLGIKTVGDLAEVASTDALRRAIAQKIELPVEVINVILKS